MSTETPPPCRRRSTARASRPAASGGARAARAPADRSSWRSRSQSSLVWLIAVQPALRTLREAPAELDRLDQQMQQMQLAARRDAGPARCLAGAAAQASDALRAATARLGEQRQARRSRATARSSPSPASGRRPARLARRGAQRRPRAAGRSAAASRPPPATAARSPSASGAPRDPPQAQPPALGADRRRHGWSESTLAEQAWARRAAPRCAGPIAGVLFGLVVGLVLFAPAAWLAKRGGLGHRPAAGARRCARHDLVRQRRAGPHRRRRQPRRELPARPPRVDRCRRGSTACELRGAPGLLHQRHAETADPPGLRPHRRAMRCCPARPTGSASGRAPGSAASARRGTRCSSAARVRLASPGFTIEQVAGPLAARRQASTSSSRPYRRV